LSPSAICHARAFAGDDPADAEGNGKHGGAFGGAARQPDPEKVTLTRAITGAPALDERSWKARPFLYLKPGG